MRLQTGKLARLALVLSSGLLPLLSGCSGDDPRTVPIAAVKTEPKAEAPALPGADAMAERYIAIKERYAALAEDDAEGPKKLIAEVGGELRQIAENATDVHLRANASLLLGTIHEASGDPRTAISFYHQVIALLPEDAEPHRVLAMALARDKQFAAALPEQERVVKDDLDDLEAWLLLGEIAVKAEAKDKATEAYAGYEMRRKGLIDGISLKKTDGTFVLPAEQRAASARALIPARDNGTAIALLYALEIETDPAVRLALVEAMGTQRLAGYKPALTAKLAKETAQEVKEAMIWALAEIEREPLDTRPGPLPGITAAPAVGADGKPVEPVAPAGDATASDTKATDTKATDTKAAPAKTEAPVPADRSAGTGASGASPPAR